MVGKKQKITLGIAGAVLVLAAVASVWLALPLLVLAVLLFAWGLEPKRTEEFIGRLPYGNYPLRALAKLDSIISGWS
ncbi:MAG: hypothetical protein ACREC9_16305 [Methylocella sp.]